MPNWCYNEITIKGSKRNIKKLGTDILNAENGMLFQSLIGDRYTNNIDNWGTRDIEVNDFVDLVRGTFIELRGDTAWSPPIEFCRNLAIKYGVEIYMYYEEIGLNFAGEANINSEGAVSENDYEYGPGIYFINGFQAWLEKVFSFYSDEDIDLLDMSYLTEEEKRFCHDLINLS